MTGTFLFRRFMLALERAGRENLSAEGRPAPLPKEVPRLLRRRFVKTAACARAAGVVSAGMSRSVRALTQPAHGGDLRVAIVGGGLAALNAAYQLKKAGVDAMVYEARRRLGGRILSSTERSARGLSSEVHAGNLVFAGEHLSDGFYGFMNVAAETGRLAATFVLRRPADLAVAARRAPADDVA
jgi:monoamine oxidase